MALVHDWEARLDATKFEKRRPLLLACGIAALALAGCGGEFATHPPMLRAAEEAYDQELLLKSLEEIETWHVENETGLAGSLGAGRSPASVEAEFEGTECRPTEELKALWSWRDGGIGPVPFVWYHDFLPLKAALSEYKSLLRHPLLRWDPRYIPVFSYEGEWYGAYCGENAVNAGPIYFFFTEDEAGVSHVNLTVFLAGMSESFQSGAVRWQNGSMLEDLRELRSIHQKYNPGYGFPYLVEGEQ